MGPFSTVTIGLFFAGYVTARWDLLFRLKELAIFAWYHQVLVRSLIGFVILSGCFTFFIAPVVILACKETDQNPRPAEGGLSAREQLKRRGSF